MAIVFPLTLPTATGMRNLTVTPTSFVAVVESPFTGAQQAQRNQGQYWLWDIALPTMSRDNAAEWEAFFLSLNGREGTFLMGDPSAATPRGAGGGTPLINGAGQVGQTINTDGWPVSTVNVLKKNDYVQFGTGANARLYRQLVDVNSDGSGNVALTLWPRVTQANAQADNAAIIITNTVGVFRIADDAVPFTISTALLRDYKFKAISQV